MKSIKEIKEKIFKDLKDGEPFSYHLEGDMLIIGVSMGWDESHNEYEIFECVNSRRIKLGLIKLKKKKQ